MMYGSSLTRVTRNPLASRIAASDAEAMPFPSEDTTPPVMKMKRDIGTCFNGAADRPPDGSAR